MKRRGAGNRSARRVICIHVRCCLATWQPGHPFSSYPPVAHTFSPSLPSPSAILILLVLLILSLPRRAVRPASLTYVPIDHFPRNPLLARVSTSTLQCAARRAIEIPTGYNKVLLLSRLGSKTKGRRSKGTKQDRAGGCLQRTDFREVPFGRYVVTTGSLVKSPTTI